MKRRSTWPLLAVFAFTLAGVAIAQAATGTLTGFLPNLAEWYSSPFALAGAIAIAVQFLKEHVLTGLKGGAVIAVSLGLGGLLGAVGIWADLLVGGLVEGVAFGVISGFLASGGYDLVKELFKRWGITSPVAIEEAVVVPQAVGLSSLGVAPASAAASSLVSPDSAVDFILGLVRGRFGGADAVPPFVWGVVETLSREFAGRALTPELRRTIQRRLLDLLAGAGAPGRDL